MSSATNKLLVLASNFESLAEELFTKNAIDIGQPEDFEEQYQKWVSDKFDGKYEDRDAHKKLNTDPFS
jgi:hypothetical protein